MTEHLVALCMVNLWLTSYVLFERLIHDGYIMARSGHIPMINHGSRMLPFGTLAACSLESPILLGTGSPSSPGAKG